MVEVESNGHAKSLTDVMIMFGKDVAQQFDKSTNMFLFNCIAIIIMYFYVNIIFCHEIIIITRIDHRIARNQPILEFLASFERRNFHLLNDCHIDDFGAQDANLH